MWSVLVDRDVKRMIRHVQQYHMILLRPAVLNMAYKVGMEGYKLCAGRLIEPWIVPPYIIVSFVTHMIVDVCMEVYLMIVAA
jgi:hypothetical protein